jgi:RNA polymerase sigma-70 factor (ECF subfamily)
MTRASTQTKAATQADSTPAPDRPRETGSSESHERCLLGRIGARDREAMRQLYLLYHRRLTRFLSRMLRSRALIDEAVNDTFVIVWQKAGEFRGDSRLSTWIMGIAYRRGLNLLRAESRADELLISPTSADDLSSVEDGESPELSDLLDRAMACLTADHRTVLEMTYYLGYSCEEIAKIVGCPASTVRTRMFHARNKLRALIPALSDPRLDRPSQIEGSDLMVGTARFEAGTLANA